MKSGWYNANGRKRKIERVAGWYDVRTGDLPFSHFTLKVVEGVDGGFMATPNVFVKSSDGIDYTCGVGATVEDAVLDGINAFYGEIEKVAPIESITEDSFVWMAWTPFGPASLDSTGEE